MIGTPVVDAHVHLFRRVGPDHPRSTLPVMAEASREELAERLLAAMAAAGVDHAVVVPLSSEDHYLREVLAAFPGRFAGVGVYDHDDRRGVDAFIARLDDTAMQGVRFLGLGAPAGATPESLACYRAIEVMAERGVAMWFYGDLGQLTVLDALLRRLPRLRVVLNHCAFLPDPRADMTVDEHGRPRFDIALPPAGLTVVEAMAVEHPSLHVLFSGQYAFSKRPYPFADLHEVAARLHGAFGADRMLMASDWPWIEREPGYGRALALVDHLLPDLTADERAAIRGGTALRLFRF